jgi:hypothetical protein
MKVFHYRHGKVSAETLTVGELQGVLRGYPADLPVFGTYEGVFGPIGRESFEVKPVHQGDPLEETPCLVIDVEER